MFFQISDQKKIKIFKNILWLQKIKLLTNMFNIFKALPFAWVHMTGRKCEDYEVVFRRIREINEEYCPKKAHTDYEKGLRKALEIVFGKETDLIGCLFHYGQVIFIEKLYSKN